MRIFLSVGTHPQPFDRIAKEMDRLIGSGELEVEVFMQSGHCIYAPKNFHFERIISLEEFQKRIKEADIVVSHGGAGTIINCLRLNKPLIVAPRLKKFGEHTNDHQLELAQALEEQGKAIVVKDEKQLLHAIRKAAKFKPRLASGREQLVKRVRQFLEAAA